MSRISGVASAFPRHFCDQAALAAALKKIWGDRLPNPEIIERLHTRTGVDRRHLSLPVDQYESLRTWGKANDAWIAAAQELGEKAIECALRRSGVPKSDLGAIFVVSARGHIALVGDASGSVDAITGQGLCLAFRQAVALGRALENQDLRSFEAAQRRFARKPVFMSRLMLAMGRLTRVRRLAMLALAARPGLFSLLLEFHVGSKSTPAPGPLGLTRPAEGRPV